MRIATEPITVMTAVNDDYVLPLSVMLRSLATCTPEAGCLEIRILTAGLSTDVRRRLGRSLAGLNLNLLEVEVDPSLLHGMKVTGHVSLETYFRLLAPSLFPSIDRILYLDADIIVRHSVDELYKYPFGGAHLLAVPHASKKSAFFSSERGVPSYSVLGIPGCTRTFNAGVMLLDLDRWRQTDTTGRILSYLRKHRSDVLWWDQDGLNAVLYDKWKPLPAKWNVMSSHFGTPGDLMDTVLDSSTHAAIMADPAIIHYSSPSKPWLPNYTGPFREHWLQAYESAASFFEA